VNERNYDSVDGSGPARLEYDVAKILAGRPLERPITDDEAESLAGWIGRVWQVASVSIPAFLAQYGSQLKPDTRERLAAISAAAALQGRLSRQVAAEVARAFADRGIELVALKGTANGFVGYDDPTCRTGADLDFGVREDELEDAKAVLRSIGFWPGAYDPETQTFAPTNFESRAKEELDHYALGFWLKIIDLGQIDPQVAEGFRRAGDLLPFASEVDGNSVRTPILVDIHHAIGSGISIDDILDRPVPHDWNGTRFLLPPAEWMAFHALFKLYWEGAQSNRKGFQYLSDFARIALALDEEEIDAFASLVEGHNLRRGAAYVLRRMPGVLGEAMPESFRYLLDQWQTLRPGETPRSSNDIGDFWPHMFGRL